MTPAVALRLGRVSNLPTVWTNGLAGMVLAGTLPAAPKVGAVMLALSFFYVGGMYLNDAFDRRIDALERPDRPIPSGQATAGTVFLVGFGMLAAAAAILAWLASSLAAGWRISASGAALTGAILLYDWRHKDNPLSPAIMGLCRALVYVTAAYAVSVALPVKVIAAAFVLLCYVVGLTHAARYEASGRVGAPWPLLVLVVPAAYGIGLNYDHPLGLAVHIAFAVWLLLSIQRLQRGGKEIPRAVGDLIAGIALFDASLMASQGAFLPVGLALVAFALTLALQRHVPGT